MTPLAFYNVCIRKSGGTVDNRYFTRFFSSKLVHPKGSTAKIGIYPLTF